MISHSRLMEYSANRITKSGELVVTSQESRTQSSNKEDCIWKLKTFIAEAYMEPKERKIYEGLSEQGKENRRAEKKKRAAVKSVRREKSFDYDD